MRQSVKRKLFAVAAIGLSILGALLAGEIAVRVYLSVKRTLNRSDMAIVFDRELGWRAAEGYRYTGERYGANGESYSVDIETNEKGFRRYGDVHSNQVKLFIIGDSYTHAIEVSNGQAYYDRIQQALPVECFAYGALGYGTLQEYLILKRFAPEIRPDIILWQFAANDIINNSYEFERRSRANNNGMRRPYLARDGRIEYAIPSRVPLVRTLSNHYSLLLYFVVSRLDRIGARRDTTASITREGMANPIYAQAVQATDRIIRSAKEEFRGSAIIFMYVDEYQPFADSIRSILARQGVEAIDTVYPALDAARRRNLPVYAADGSHFSELGHRIAAECVIDYLSERMDNLSSTSN